VEIIDAWMQHPSAEFLADPVFDSLRRWAHGRLAGGEVPVADTVAAMDQAGVRTGMLSADCLHGLAGLGLDDETSGLFLHGTPNGSSACRQRPVRPPASRTPAGKERGHDGPHHPR